MVVVRIPTPLRKFTGGRAEVEVEGASVREVLDGIETSHAGMKEKIIEPTGDIRSFVNVFVNGDNVRDLQGLDTAVNAGDELMIVPAIAGGRETKAEVS